MNWSRSIQISSQHLPAVPTITPFTPPSTRPALSVSLSVSSLLVLPHTCSLFPHWLLSIYTYQSLYLGCLPNHTLCFFLLLPASWPLLVCMCCVCDLALCLLTSFKPLPDVFVTPPCWLWFFVFTFALLASCCKVTIFALLLPLLCDSACWSPLVWGSSTGTAVSCVPVLLPKPSGALLFSFLPVTLAEF